MPVGGPYFPSVRKAKAALRERAFELLDGYIAIIKQAAAQGDFETAAKGYQYLLEHMPEEEGERMLDISIDRPKQAEQKSGHTIQIGFQLGGIPYKELDTAVIDTKLVDDHDEKL